MKSTMEHCVFELLNECPIENSRLIEITFGLGGLNVQYGRQYPLWQYLKNLGDEPLICEKCLSRLKIRDYAAKKKAEKEARAGAGKYFKRIYRRICPKQEEDASRDASLTSNVSSNSSSSYTAPYLHLSKQLIRDARDEGKDQEFADFSYGNEDEEANLIWFAHSCTQTEPVVKTKEQEETGRGRKRTYDEMKSALKLTREELNTTKAMLDEEREGARLVSEELSKTNATNQQERLDSRHYEEIIIANLRISTNAIERGKEVEEYPLESTPMDLLDSSQLK